MKRVDYLHCMVVSLLVGMIYVLPHIFMIKESPGWVHLPFSFAETLYGAQVNEMLEGHTSIGDPQFFETKYTFPPIFPYIPIAILALVSFMSGSIISGFYISDFIFPFILSYILILFLYSVFKNKSVAVLLSLMVMFLYPFILRFPPLSLDGLIQLMKEFFLIEINDRLPFYRTPNPQISFIFLVVALWSLWKLWQTQRKIFLLGSIVFGTLLYSVYFYHTIYFLSLTGVLWIFSITAKKRQLVIYFTVLLICMCGVGGFYLFLSHNPIYADIHITGGRFYSRYVDWLYTLRYGVFSILILVFLRRIASSIYYFFLAIPIAATISMNLQIFTGWTMQPGHFSQTTIEPLITIIVGAIILYFFNIESHKKTVWIFIYILFVYGILTQTLQTHRYKNTWAIRSDFKLVIDWLQKNTDKNTVIVSLNPGVLAYVHVLTPANVYLPIEEYHYATISEIWDRVLNAYSFYEIPLNKFEPDHIPYVTFFELTYNVNQYKHEEFDEYTLEMQNKIKACYPSLCSGLYSIPQSLRDSIIKKYKNENFSKHKYRADYIIISDYERELSAKQYFGRQLFRAGEYEIYAIN